MRVSGGLLAVVLGFLAVCIQSVFASAQFSDREIAEHTLGPQWQQMSRRAEMIFVGTVLAVDVPSVKNSNLVERSAQGLPAVFRVTFHVDRAIAGVTPGEVLTIREWAGAISAQRTMNVSEHLLLFLYVPSRLGLTSPVGGARGQILLDGGGRFVASDEADLVQPVTAPRSLSGSPPVTVVPSFVRPSANTVDQLERAIRSARGE
jgi:hypothetical protein